MAIVQISRITNRKGLQSDLPQLAGAELGWSIDERRLFIGNGTLEEGAPAIGNTEILTEFSDIFEFQTNYTYKGAAAGYTVQTGPTPSDPVSQSLQSWLDQFATVKDFGAVGDGLTDDTEAINRALYQLYCRESNTQIRRSLFFPAGTYRVTETILIPPYATLYGEGIDGSIIFLDIDASPDSTLNAYVARTANSLQQYGANIPLGGTAPQFITISNMGFQNGDPTTDVFLVEDANNCRFTNVGFFGPLAQSALTSEGNATTGVRFASTSALITNQIVFDGCKFSGTVYGVNSSLETSTSVYEDQWIEGITICNSKFDTLYRGIVLGVESLQLSSGPTGVRIVNNMFDNIYAEGIIFGQYATLNASGCNIFYGVGNRFGPTTTPYSAIIDIDNNNNVSIGDMFERGDAYSNGISSPLGTSYPRIVLNDTTSIAITNSSQIAIGSYVRETGKTATLTDNTAAATTIFTINAELILAFSVDYTIVRDQDYRTGVLTVSTDGSSTNLTLTDDYTENSSTGVTLTVVQTGTTVSIKYTTNSTGYNATMTYSVNHLV